MRSSEPARGFSLLEMLVALTILAASFALAAPRLAHWLAAGERREAERDIAALARALELFRLHAARYPTAGEGLAALVAAPPGLTQWRGPYLAGAVPADPWGGAYLYAPPTDEGPPRLRSLGADGRPGGEGRDADIAGP